jgi:transaldolase
MPALDSLKVKIFADGADCAGIREMAAKRYIAGFTTNPTLMRKAGVTDYRAFGKEALDCVGGRPISFEVFSDEFEEMERQAREIASWGRNVYVKIPVTNTRAEPSYSLIRRLAQAGIQLNITAMLTLQQVREVSKALAGGAPSYISVFAGRVADTGVDPLPVMTEALSIMRPHPTQELIWASPRELLNVVQADAIGCHVITCTSDVLAKLGTLGKDLEQFSLETVQMFHRDAVTAGFEL